MSARQPASVPTASSLTVSASDASRVTFGPFKPGESFSGVLVNYFTAATPAAGESIAVRVVGSNQRLASAAAVLAARRLHLSDTLPISKADATAFLALPWRANIRERYITIEFTEADGDAYTAVVMLVLPDSSFMSGSKGGPGGGTDAAP